MALVRFCTVLLSTLVVVGFNVSYGETIIPTDPGAHDGSVQAQGLVNEETVSEPLPVSIAQQFPIHITAGGSTSPQIQLAPITDGRLCLTIIGKVYLWWRDQDRVRGDVHHIELQADRIVLFFTEDPNKEGSDWDPLNALDEAVPGDLVDAIYLAGDVVMAEGPRTIRADEVFYDLRAKRALAMHAVLRTFDARRGIPIFVRADKLRQVTQDIFTAEDVVLTTSEFYTPQLSFSTARVVITDTTAVDTEKGRLSDGSFNARMEDVRFNLYDQTLFAWPVMQTDLERPDVPLRGIHLGHDSIWGNSLETRWYLSRLLGWQQRAGTEGTFFLDYYDKRGPGTGLEVDYVEEQYFGHVLGYIIHDAGEDHLGRVSDRRDLLPPDKIRGRFKIQHRHFLPDQWQISTEASYLSDEHFLEQFYRQEYFADKEQEALVHCKRIQDNWAVSLLTKGRINDFSDTLEELPGAQWHWTGQSLGDGLITLYSDNEISRFRQHFGSRTPYSEPIDYFTFASSRQEADMPLSVGHVGIVPYTAVTFGFDDGAGFYTDTGGATVPAESAVCYGEAGLRVSYRPWWKVYPDVQSRLWDLNQLRHVVEPRLLAVTYGHSNSVIEQRDILGVGLSQRFQTRRGHGSKKRTLDWLRWDIDCVWLDNGLQQTDHPSRLAWNNPGMPLADRYSQRFIGAYSRRLPSLDRRSSDGIGPGRSYVSTDIIWCLTDCTSVLMDGYIDTLRQTVQQWNVGLTHMRWPDLSWYVGSRYIRDLDNGLGERGSNVLTVAATYKLDPRYTLVVSHHYDVDYGASIRSEATLIRKYHRLQYGLCFSVDESLEQTSVVFSLWPQGIPEMGIGLSRYMDVGL